MVPLGDLSARVLENLDDVRVFHVQQCTADDVVAIDAVVVDHLESKEFRSIRENLNPPAGQ